jgi:hypothetical protein
MKLCRECRLEEAGDDGFCSDTCAEQWDQEMYGPDGEGIYLHRHDRGTLARSL